MKSLLVIWAVAIATGVGGTVYLDQMFDELAVEAVQQQKQISLEYTNGFQTFGPAEEDELTNSQALQPTADPQVELNGGLVQGSFVNPQRQ